MNKLFLALLAASLPLSAQALTFEYPYLYKDPRAMGMGGAGVAVGGSAGSLFSNPAGLAKIDPEVGIEVDLLPLNISYNDNVQSFADAMKAATDSSLTQTQQDQATNDVLRAYMGKNLHFDFQTFPSVAKKGEEIGFAVGYLATGKFDGRSHQGFGTEGLLEVDANATSGPVFGFSYDLMGGDLSVGMSWKNLDRTSVRHNFTARELVEQSNTMGTYIKDNVKQEGSGNAIDLGAIYKLSKDDAWRPTVGISLLNVGGLDFGGAGKIPSTVNVGIAAHPDVGFFNLWTVAVDYVDVFNGYEQDKDIKKRLRLGGEIRFWENPFTGMAARAGLYQNKPTFGADFRLLTFKFMYTTYTEEVGAYAGQDPDRRHMLSFVFGW